MVYWYGHIVAFYKQKQRRRGGVEENYVEAIKISPAEGKVLITIIAYIIELNAM